MIACYDLKDNLIAVFDSYKECAKWFNTTANAIYIYFSKQKHEPNKAKYDTATKTWYRLFKIEGR